MTARRLPAPVRLAALPLALLVPAVLAGCGSSGSADASSSPAVTVNATDTQCDLSGTTLQPGTTTFSVSNKGSKVTEVYVYGKSGEAFTTVVAEVEDIGPGLTRELTADLDAGTYEVACKPGQTGDGIRTRVTVGTAGQAASATGSATGSVAAGGREIPIATDGKAITGMDGAQAKVGETVELELANNADGPRTLEVKRPDGKVAGEVADIAVGAVGRLTLTLDVAGSWSVIVEGTEPEPLRPLTVS
jgi:iron uptake system component EfeO